jgi:LPXTG-motif cell wall-anchored protein
MHPNRPEVPSFIAAAPPANAFLNYYGGRIIQNVHVVPVLWGKNVPSEVATQISSFYAAATSSPLYDMLAEYNTSIKTYSDGAGTGQKLGHGTAEAAIAITPSITSTSITDQQITQELQAQINAGHLPAPDANTLYMVHYPAGMSISMPDGNGGTATSCKQFCAYHSTIQHSPTTILYGTIPNVTTDGCELGCGPIGGGFNNTTSVASHELVEATTDADVGLAQNYGPPLGWYDPQGQDGEIGDICNGMQGTITSQNKSWTVQLEWSNTHGGCIAAPSSTDFALVLNPGNRAIAAGSSATFTVSSQAIAGTPGTITLDASGFPAGMSGSFDKTSISPGQSATLTVSATSSATNGDQYFTIHGSAGSTQRQSKAVATISGGSGGGGGGGNCPPGTTDIGGICIPTGCESTSNGPAWIGLLGVGAALFLVRRVRRS